MILRDEHLVSTAKQFAVEDRQFKKKWAEMFSIFSDTEKNEIYEMISVLEFDDEERAALEYDLENAEDEETRIALEDYKKEMEALTEQWGEKLGIH